VFALPSLVKKNIAVVLCSLDVKKAVMTMSHDNFDDYIP